VREIVTDTNVAKTLTPIPLSITNGCVCSWCLGELCFSCSFCLRYKVLLDARSNLKALKRPPEPGFAVFLPPGFSSSVR